MSAEMFSLAGKTALVTGASRGIGAGVARALAAAGADVALAARSEQDLAAVAADIARLGRAATAIRCDVTRSDDVAACVRQAEDALGRIDVLVNNAGGPLFNAPFLDTREDGWQRVLDLNLMSVVRFCREAGRGMVARGSGSVVNVASLAANRPWPALAPYSAAKAAVLSLTQVLALEWAEYQVRVNAITPGWVMTEVNRRVLTDERTSALVRDSIPMVRHAEVEEVVGAVVWLASDSSRYVTGANIAIDGGVAVGVPEDWRALRLR